MSISAPPKEAYMDLPYNNNRLGLRPEINFGNQKAKPMSQFVKWIRRTLKRRGDNTSLIQAIQPLSDAHPDALAATIDARGGLIKVLAYALFAKGGSEALAEFTKSGALEEAALTGKEKPKIGTRQSALSYLAFSSGLDIPLLGQSRRAKFASVYSPASAPTLTHPARDIPADLRTGLSLVASEIDHIRISNLVAAPIGIPMDLGLAPSPEEALKNILRKADLAGRIRLLAHQICVAKHEIGSSSTIIDDEETRNGILRSVGLIVEEKDLKRIISAEQAQL